MCVSKSARAFFDCRGEFLELNRLLLQDVAAKWEDLVLAEAEQARLIDSCITRCAAAELILIARTVV